MSRARPPAPDRPPPGRGLHPLRDGHDRPRHGLGGAGGDRQGRLDRLRQPGRHDPARQSQILVGVQPAYGVSHFDKSGDSRGGGNGGNAQGFAPGGALYGVYSATPDLKLGLSLGSYFAGSLQYQDNWSGPLLQHQVRAPDLRRLPNAAYRINRWLSVGVGPHILYGKLDEKVAVPNVAGGDGSFQVDQSDVGFGGMAGVLLEPTRTPASASPTSRRSTSSSRTPAAHRRRADPDHAAAAARALTRQDSTSSLTVPQQVMASAYHELTDRLAIMANVDWQDWSQFGEPEIR